MTFSNAGSGLTDDGITLTVKSNDDNDDEIHPDLGLPPNEYLSLSAAGISWKEPGPVPPHPPNEGDAWYNTTNDRAYVCEYRWIAFTRPGPPGEDHLPELKYEVRNSLIEAIEEIFTIAKEMAVEPNPSRLRSRAIRLGEISEQFKFRNRRSDESNSSD